MFSNLMAENKKLTTLLAEMNAQNTAKVSSPYLFDANFFARKISCPLNGQISDLKPVTERGK